MEKIENDHWNTKEMCIMDKDNYFFNSVSVDFLRKIKD